MNYTYVFNFFKNYASFGTWIANSSQLFGSVVSNFRLHMSTFVCLSVGPWLRSRSEATSLNKNYRVASRPQRMCCIFRFLPCEVSALSTKSELCPGQSSHANCFVSACFSHSQNKAERTFATLYLPGCLKQVCNSVYFLPSAWRFCDTCLRARHHNAIHCSGLRVLVWCPFPSLAVQVCASPARLCLRFIQTLNCKHTS